MEQHMDGVAQGQGGTGVGGMGTEQHRDRVTSSLMAQGQGSRGMQWGGTWVAWGQIGVVTRDMGIGHHRDGMAWGQGGTGMGHPRAWGQGDMGMGGHKDEVT